MDDTKQKRSYVIAIICFVFGIVFFTCGMIRIKTDANEEKDTKDKTEQLSPGMIKFLSLTFTNGDNILDSSAYRKLYVNIELDSSAKKIKDGEMEVSYVDYDTYKNKYEEIFGDNYNFEEDYNQVTGGGADPTSCSKYSSVEDNSVCWTLDFGEGSIKVDYVQKNEYSENDLYYKTGNFHSEEVEADGEYTIVYTVKNDKKYLKNISQKTIEATS